jgi:hypothetical protein
MAGTPAPFTWAEMAAMAIRRRRGAQGHFQGIEAPLYQRFGQRDGMAQLLDDDDRNEARALEVFGKFHAWTLDFATLL